ncbi:phage holin, LLH family [Leuconostoc citreum]|uniref:phage holin, LLH family n=1 Tax=Leuconostoc citreum TaxID=33964 RepID=UPI00186B83BC|nr:phage holin, LLH family [Leuconostoc citreum]MBE4726275.1 hypothetical protein [Leuconostoc citreum]
MSKTDVWGIIVALWTSGVITAVGHAGMRFIKANTKNKNVQLFAQWADQAVSYAENNAATSETKKKQAEMFLTQRLFANNLDKAFSTDQVDAVIEQAVAKLHDWHPEIKEEGK